MPLEQAKPRALAALLTTLKTKRVTLAAAALTVLFLWLVSGLKVQALFNQVLDDALYLQTASNLLKLKWLGVYNVRTLVKGPGYPAFLAVCALLRLPVLVAQAALYAGACAAFCAAVRPLLERAATRLSLYAALLCNPCGFAMTRIMRDWFYTSLVVLALASALALYLRRAQGVASRENRWWLLGLVAPLSVALITREEGVWLLPFLLLLACATAATIWQSPHFDRRRRLKDLLILGVGVPLLTFAPMVAVSALNAAAYKRVIVTELTRPEFADAVGAVMRVRASKQSQDVYVPRDARERIYAVSPSFASLRDFFETKGRGFSCRGELRLVADACRRIDADEIPMSWFVWALRTAASDAGFHASARKAAGFYRTLAKEVNDACNGGRLQCLPARSSLIPPWQAQYPSLIARSFVRALTYVANMQMQSASVVATLRSQSGGSTAQDHKLKIFRGEIAPFTGQVTGARATQGGARLMVMDTLLWCYRRVLPFALGAAALAIALLLIFSLRRRQFPDALMVPIALAVALVTRLVLIATVDALSFPAINQYYLAPAFPIALAFSFLALHASGRLRMRPQG